MLYEAGNKKKRKCTERPKMMECQNPVMQCVPQAFILGILAKPWSPSASILVAAWRNDRRAMGLANVRNLTENSSCSWIPNELCLLCQNEEEVNLLCGLPMRNFPLIESKTQKYLPRICNKLTPTVVYGLNSCYPYSLKNLKPLGLVASPGNKQKQIKIILEKLNCT